MAILYAILRGNRRRRYREKGKRDLIRVVRIFLTRGYYDFLVGLQVSYPTEGPDNFGDVFSVANKTANVCAACSNENPIFSGPCSFEGPLTYSLAAVSEDVIGCEFQDLSSFAKKLVRC